VKDLLQIVIVKQNQENEMVKMTFECLGLSFRVIPVVLIVGQPKNSGNWKKTMQAPTRSQNLLKYRFFQGKFLLFGLVHHQKHVKS
jgi:hypothetical protein